MGGRPLEPQNICPFKGISSWNAQNPLQGCQRLTARQRAGMSVKTELGEAEDASSSELRRSDILKVRRFPLIMKELKVRKSLS